MEGDQDVCKIYDIDLKQIDRIVESRSRCINVWFDQDKVFLRVVENVLFKGMDNVL